MATGEAARETCIRYSEETKEVATGEVDRAAMETDIECERIRRRITS